VDVNRGKRSLSSSFNFFVLVVVQSKQQATHKKAEAARARSHIKKARKEERGAEKN
jgi:hypothetical protein